MYNFINNPKSIMIYLVVIITTLLLIKLSIINKKYSFIIFIIAVLIISVFSGLRDSSVGTDTKNYYKHIETALQNYNRYPSEPGFFFIVSVVKKYSVNVKIIMSVIAFLINFLILVSLRNTLENTAILYSSALYLNFYFTFTLSGLRQWLAISIIFYSLKYLMKKEYLYFGIFVFLSSQFHNSSLINLLLIPTHMIFTNTETIRNNIKNNKKILIYFMVLLVVLLVGTMTIFYRYDINVIPKYITYFKKLKISGNFSTFTIAKLITIIPILKHYKNSYYFNEELKLYTKFYVIYLLTFIVANFFMNISRITLYLIPFELLFLGKIYEIKNMNNDFLISVCMMYMISLISLLLELGLSTRIIPYFIIRTLFF